MKEILQQIQMKGPQCLDELHLSEPIPVVRGREVLFLYDERIAETKEVRLVHHVSTLDRAPKLTRVNGSAIKALHLVLPKIARLEYTFGIKYTSGYEEIRTDPLNPDLAWCPFGPKSVVVTAGYQIPSWTIPHPENPQGWIEEHLIQSSVFNDSRTVWVYLPAMEPQNQKYPLLVVHDGTDYFHFADFKTVLDNLIASGQMQPVVALLSKPENRNEEYSCTPDHAKFVGEELIPWARNRYPVTSSRSGTGLMGSSFGAVASIYAAYQYPRLFGLLLIQSGSFRFQDIVSTNVMFDPVDPFDRIKLFIESQYFPGGPNRKMRVFQTCGTFEPMIGYNDNFYKMMKKYHHQIHYQTSNDGHNWVSWRDHLGQGLPYLFPAGRNVRKKP